MHLDGAGVWLRAIRAEMTKAVGYIRVSKEEMAQTGYSLEAQEARIRAQAQVSELDITEIMVDRVSAKDLKRPAMERLIKMARAREIDVIVIPKLDRFTRNVKDLLFWVDLLEETGVRLISLHETLDTKTATGRMVITIIAAVAQMEREQIGERTRAVLQYKKSIGERTGNIPYGYDADENGKLVTNPQEQRIIAEARGLRDVGYSLREIAESLNVSGFLTRRGSPWKHQYVARILRDRETTT